MKKFFKILVLFLSVNTSLLIISGKADAQAVSFQVFYDDLSPYGSWFESPDYGYVWRPQLSGFAPYSTNGYWVLTDAGWTWVSDYSWGWAPFHYGRWYNDPFYGYVWVPGYEWGPGWVSWRRSNDYYGWAPIGPGININVAYGSGYNLPYDQWNFVSCNDFGRSDIRNHYIDRSKNVTIINNTTVINTTKVDRTRNTTYSPGPDRAEVQKKIGKAVNPVAIEDEKKPAQRITKNGVQLYRPLIQNNSNAATKPAPAKVTPLNEVKAQSGNAKPGKEHEAINERQVKPVQTTGAVKSTENPPMQQNNQSNELQQPVKKSPRDEQPPEQRSKIENNTAPVKQPVQEPLQKPTRDEQPAKAKQAPQQIPVQHQNNVPPVKQRPVQRQPVNPQRTQPSRVQQQPIRQPNPVRQPSMRPQQNINRAPIRQQPVRQQPAMRPPPMQRPAPAPGNRKG